ncbi:hypothetical protein F4813DRAFT_390093 [Daldinia decipiens]|uniref:uncharacterized protein n=1 Tax=Daldinia decipiens TaxID=326647 RepID=UPI0020C42D5F|nr:uncharacterized protein F4813DRAFT_390093 [Daldinia decipiens]KAI1657120.1 hypothetical protein F4813DRAFT_390093 [Daldinia decipiens]
MCQIWSQEYSECHHVSRNLIHCPTYYKQQSEANGFLGRLLNGSVKRKKDCGRVIPHHGDPAPFCPTCSVKNDQLWGNQVGDGALRVRHPHMKDEYQHSSTEHRERSENSAEKSCKRSDRHGQQGVWIPGLYYEPENLAQRDPYIRTAGKARPVSPVQSPPPPRPPRSPVATPNPPHRPEQKRDKPETRPPSSTKTRDEHRNQASASKQPTQNPERKGDTPVKRNEHRPRAPTKETSSSNTPSRRSNKKPAEPAQPKRDRQRREADDDRDRDKYPKGRRPSRKPTPARSPRRSPPTPPPKDPERKWPPPIRHHIDPVPIPIPKPQPRPRRKPVPVHHHHPPHPIPPSLKPPPAPLPEYQVYLNAQRFADEQLPPAAPAIEKSTEPPMFMFRPPPQRSKGYHMITGTGRRVGPLRFSDASSDESFVCRDARMLTLNAAAAGAAGGAS